MSHDACGLLTAIIWCLETTPHWVPEEEKALEYWEKTQMIPCVWLNQSGSHKLATQDSLTARRKSWHSQATWLMCMSNISSFTCFSYLITVYGTITGFQDLEVKKNNIDFKSTEKWAIPHQSHEMIYGKQFCCCHVQANSVHLNCTKLLSIRQYKVNSGIPIRFTKIILDPLASSLPLIMVPALF